MRKILTGFSILVLILITTGCGTTKTVGNLEYMEQIMTSRGDILQFKDSEGYIINYFVDSRDSFSLTKGTKYDVEVTVENPLNRRDFVVKVKERENKIK
ncbi:hypothetical protein [Paenibacillus sp. USHLN196]|uniref:hypothetical protein n=1 Tax=Paenibacillus sp. USHLN196 TaxID=3081291 RepID=UPI00301B4D11